MNSTEKVLTPDEENIHYIPLTSFADKSTYEKNNTLPGEGSTIVQVTGYRKDRVTQIRVYCQG